MTSFDCIDNAGPGELHILQRDTAGLSQMAFPSYPPDRMDGRVELKGQKFARKVGRALDEGK
jgi:hypothetical protein